MATCSGADAPTLQVRATPSHVSTRRHGIIRVRVRTMQGDALVPVPGATVRLAGRRAQTDGGGGATILVRLRHRHVYGVTATRAGCTAGRASIRAAR
jgi:hypothetical protein